jgi:DNA-binding CsgD family transcriptional regulator
VQLQTHVTELLERLAGGGTPEPIPPIGEWVDDLRIDVGALAPGSQLRLVEYALVQAINGHPIDAADTLDLADELGRGDEVVSLLTATGRAVIDLYTGRIDEAAVIAEDVIDRCRRSTRAAELAGYAPETGCGVILARCGRTTDGLAAIARERQLLRIYGLTWIETMCDADAAMVMVDGGDWDGALETIDDGLRRADEAGQHAFAPWLAALRCVVLAQRGEVDEAAVALERAEHGRPAVFSGGAQVWWARAALAEARRDAAARADAFAELEAAILAAGCTAIPSVIGIDAVRAHLAVADLERAETVSERVPTSAVWPAVEAAARAARALVAGHPGTLVAAARALDGIWPFAAARIWEDATRIAPTDADRVAWARHAARGYRTVGASTSLERVAELAPIGSDPGADGALALDSLTPTERRVTALVVAGRSNAEIAHELSISRRTVESHLSRVFTKVGVRSRLQLAVAAREAEADGGTVTSTP